MPEIYANGIPFFFAFAFRELQMRRTISLYAEITVVIAKRRQTPSDIHPIRLKRSVFN